MYDDMKLVHLEQCCSLSTVIITDSYIHMMALLLALQVKLLQYGIWEHFQISDNHYIPFIHVESTSLGVTSRGVTCLKINSLIIVGMWLMHLWKKIIKS